MIPLAETSFWTQGQLRHKDVEWSWGETQEKAFKMLKKLLTESPILVHYDHKSELVIQCDASAYGIGAALMQKGKALAYARSELVLDVLRRTDS